MNTRWFIKSKLCKGEHTKKQLIKFRESKWHQELYILWSLLIKREKQWASDREPLPWGQPRWLPQAIISEPHFQFEWMPPVLFRPAMDGVFWFKKQKEKDSCCAFYLARVASVFSHNRAAGSRTYARIFFPNDDFLNSQKSSHYSFLKASLPYILSPLADQMGIFRSSTYPVPGCGLVSSTNLSIVHMCEV